ncbi:MAG: hypothetical protein QOJ36_550 [Verrucomicrobiota bacterium]
MIPCCMEASVAGALGGAIMVGAVDLNRSERQSGSDRFGEWSRREPSDIDGKAREGE